MTKVRSSQIMWQEVLIYMAAFTAPCKLILRLSCSSRRTSAKLLPLSALVVYIIHLYASEFPQTSHTVRHAPPSLSKIPAHSRSQNASGATFEPSGLLGDMLSAIHLLVSCLARSSISRDRLLHKWSNISKVKFTSAATYSHASSFNGRRSNTW